MIFARNAALLYLSFVVSGLTNVAAQSFFAHAAPDQKQLWLAATLLLGTVGSLAGVSLARRVGFPGRAGLTGTAVMVALTVAVWSVLHVTSILLYVGLHVAARTLAFREHVTREAQRGQLGWLAIYNNLGNTSALLGFGSMVALVAAGRASGIRYGALLSAGVATLGLAGLVTGALAARILLRAPRRGGDAANKIT